MMESENNIQSLPNEILEEIFSYVPCTLILRAVSKKFCDIVNNSPKLLSPYAFYFREIESKDFKNIRGCYQNLEFNDGELNNVEFVKQYKWKTSVQSIKFIIFDRKKVWTFFQQVKSILSQFDNLLDVRFDHVTWRCHTKYLDTLPSVFNPVEFRNIRSLTLKTDMRFLSLFSNAPNLEKLKIDYISKEEFSQPVNWQLKELCAENVFYETDNFLRYLTTQCSNLKVLKIYSTIDILNDIVRKLPNLEVLHLQLSQEDYIADDNLLPNDQLKELAIIKSIDKMKNGLLEQIVKHYRSIEKLYLQNEMTDVMDELMLTNLKHLTVTKHSGGILKHLRSDNLISLTFIGRESEIAKFDDVPKHKLSKIEILKVDADCLEKPKFFVNFPALRHLYLMTNCDQVEYEISLDTGLEVSTNLETLNIEKWEFRGTPEEFLLQNGYPNTIIKRHYSNYNMLDVMDSRFFKEEDSEILAEFYDENDFCDVQHCWSE